MKKTAVAALVLITSVSVSATAGTITVVSSPTDLTYIGPAPTARPVGDPSHRLGFLNAATEYTAVLPFQLPELPQGETITSVSLGISLVADYVFADYGKSLNVFGVRVGSNPAAVSTDWKAGAVIAADKIAYNNNLALGRYDISDSAMILYIQNIYDTDPNAAGKYVFLRLGLNDAGTTPPSSHWMNVAYANSPTEGERPVLSITTAAPKPAKAK